MNLREWFALLGLPPHLAGNPPSGDFRTAVSRAIQAGLAWQQGKVTFQGRPLNLHPLLQHHLSGPAPSQLSSKDIELVLRLDRTLRTTPPVFRDFLPALALSRTLYRFQTYTSGNFTGTMEQLDQAVARKTFSPDQVLPVRKQYHEDLMKTMVSISVNSTTQLNTVVETMEDRVTSLIGKVFQSEWQDTLKSYERGIWAYIQKQILPSGANAFLVNLWDRVLRDHFSTRNNPPLLQTSALTYAEHLLRLWTKYGKLSPDMEGLECLGFVILLDAGATVGMWRLLESPSSSRYPVWTGVASPHRYSLVRQLERMVKKAVGYSTPQDLRNAWIYDMAKTMIDTSPALSVMDEEMDEKEEDEAWTDYLDRYARPVEEWDTRRREEEFTRDLMERFFFTRGLLEKVRIHLQNVDKIWEDPLIGDIRHFYTTYTSLPPGELLGQFPDLLEKWGRLCRKKNRGRPSRKKQAFCKLCEELSRAWDGGELAEHWDELALIAALMDALAERIA